MAVIDKIRKPNSSDEVSDISLAAIAINFLDSYFPMYDYLPGSSQLIPLSDHYNSTPEHVRYFLPNADSDESFQKVSGADQDLARRLYNGLNAAEILRRLVVVSRDEVETLLQPAFTEAQISAVLGFDYEGLKLTGTPWFKQAAVHRALVLNKDFGVLPDKSFVERDIPYFEKELLENRFPYGLVDEKKLDELAAYYEHHPVPNHVIRFLLFLTDHQFAHNAALPQPANEKAKDVLIRIFVSLGRQHRAQVLSLIEGIGSGLYTSIAPFLRIDFSKGFGPAVYILMKLRPLSEETPGSNQPVSLSMPVFQNILEAQEDVRRLTNQPPKTSGEDGARLAETQPKSVISTGKARNAVVLANNGISQPLARLRNDVGGTFPEEQALRSFILALIDTRNSSEINGRRLALGNLNALAPDILTFYTKGEKGLIVDIQGRSAPIVFGDIHEALSTYRLSRRQNHESAGELTAQGAKEVFQSSLVLERDALERVLGTDLLIKIPVDGLTRLTTPDDFRAAFGGLLTQLVLFRDATHSRDKVSYYFKGTDSLPAWQKLLMKGMVKNLSFILKAEDESPKNALVADLTPAGTNEAIHREGNVFTPPSAGLDYAQSHEQIQWIQVLVQSYDLAAFLGKNLAGNKINKATIAQAGIPTSILERHSRYTEKKASISSKDYLKVLFDSPNTSNVLFINLAFHLPHIGPLAFWSKISDRLLRSVSAAA